ncbi:MAG: hypothetical protein LBH52_01795 [Puniceicoccales bacterium]|jgi:hypothetical protein|nr:hypothetical protein [Puniceicoccales bacterium]
MSWKMSDGSIRDGWEFEVDSDDEENVIAKRRQARAQKRGEVSSLSKA